MATTKLTTALIGQDGGVFGAERAFSHRRSIDIAGDQPAGRQPYDLAPLETKTIFDGTRSTSLANDTEFTLTLSPLSPSRYRFTWSAGTNPVLRTNRALTAATHSITIAVNANQTATMTSGTSGEFTNVVVGDTIFLPGVKTGDAATNFSDLNCGYWTVLSKTGSTVLQLAREDEEDFEGTAEVVVPAANANLQAFSAAGVQDGDRAEVSAVFSTPVLQTYDVDRCTATFFEVVATGSLPISEVAVPTTSGLKFYSSAKRYLLVESDQEVTVRINGDTGNLNKISPWTPSDPDRSGEFSISGPVWSLVMVSRSVVPAKLTVVTVE